MNSIYDTLSVIISPFTLNGKRDKKPLHTYVYDSIDLVIFICGELMRSNFGDFNFGDCQLRRSPNSEVEISEIGISEIGSEVGLSKVELRRLNFGVRRSEFGVASVKPLNRFDFSKID